MKNAWIIIVFLLSFLFLASGIYAEKTSSGSYKQEVIASEGGESETSASYKTTIAVGIINGIISSASYINKLGFFHFLLLADGQPCTSGDQCEGGFCCSSVCAISACPTGGGGGGGGGGAASAGSGGSVFPVTEQKVSDFSVSPSAIKDALSLGAVKTEQIKITNTGNTALAFSLSVATINEFVSLSESGFSLEPGQAKTIDASITGTKLGSYLGEIQIAAGGIAKSVNIIIDVESQQVLFDAKIDIPSAYKKVEPGGELKAQITLLNVGAPRKVDVTTTYIIKDRFGNVIYESSETFAVEKQTSFVKSFKVPETIKPGDYLAIIEVKYENSFAVSSELFTVVPKEPNILEKALKSNKVLVYSLAVFIGLVFLFLYLLVPRIRFPEKRNIEECRKAINYARKSIGKNDIEAAKKLYAKARNIYDGLKTKDKKNVYDELNKLYYRLR